MTLKPAHILVSVIQPTYSSSAAYWLILVLLVVIPNFTSAQSDPIVVDQHNCTNVVLNRPGYQGSPAGYYWQTSATGTSTLNNQLTYTVSTLGTSTIYLRALYQGNWTTQDSETVTVYTALNPGTITSSVGTIHCFNGSFTLTGTGASGGTGTYSYQWEYQNPGVFTWQNVSGATGQNLNVTNNYGFEYRRKVTSGVCPAQYSNVFRVNTYPPTSELTPGAISHIGYACPGTTPDPIASSSPAAWSSNSTYAQYLTYQWQTSTDAQAWVNIGGATSETFQPPSGMSQNTYYRRQVITPCGSSNTAYILITPTTLPAAPPAIQIDQVCNGNAVLYLTQPSYPTIYFWQSSATGTIIATNGSNSTSTNIVNQNGTYYVRTKNLTTGCWSSATSKTIDLNNIPQQDLTLRLNNALLLQQNENMAVSVSPKKPISKSAWSINSYTSRDVYQTTSYFDGLGRLAQSAESGYLPEGGSMLQFKEYDQLSRENKRYLPYGGCDNTGIKSVTTNQDQLAFYAKTTDKVADDVAPYSTTVFEESPMGRVTEQGKAGTAWQPGTTHTIRMTYAVNKQNEILKWTYDYSTHLINASSGTIPIYYGINELYVTRSINENGFESVTFKNKSGQTILQRIQYNASPVLYADTYTVYDDFGNVRVTLQPEGTKSLATQYFGKTDVEKEAYLKKWSFRYKYNARKQLTEKQEPGGAAIYFVYDKRDRLLFTQDGSLRPSKKWIFVKYDQLNRAVISGIYTHAGNEVTVSDMQIYAHAQMTTPTAFYEAYDGTTTNFGYTNRQFPTTGIEVLSVNYYDNYQFLTLIGGTALNFDPAHLATAGDKKLNDPVGVLTGGRVKILDTNNWFSTVSYFDSRYNVIQNINLDAAGAKNCTSVLYNFSDAVTTSKTTHTFAALPALNVVRENTYDHAGRLLKTIETINNFQPVTLYQLKYNELGQLVERNLHSRAGSAFAQSMDMRYNINGWLTEINGASDTDVNDLLSVALKYENPGVKGGPQLFNGNISEVVLKTKGTARQSYGFYYDPMSRLTESKQYNLDNPLKNGQYTMKIWDDANAKPGYDLNGNITNIKRQGQKTTGINGLMDDMAYQYEGNQVKVINDNASGTTASENGFKELMQSTNALTNPEYTYDADGNQVVDKNKGITSTEFNHLKLPKLITKGTEGYLKITYLANGTKLSQEVYSASNVLQNKTEYRGSFVYTNGQLQHILNETGKALPVRDGNGNITGFTYEYFLTDHLGNVRVVFNEGIVTTRHQATMEREPMQTEDAEEAEFLNLDEATRISSPLYNHTFGVGKSYAVRLSGSPSEVVGPAKAFTVQPGDVFDLQVFAKYTSPGTNPGNPSTLLNALIGAFNLSSAGAVPLEGGQAYNSFNSIFAPGPYIGTSTPFEDSDAPKAYLNYLLFDNNFVLKDFGFDQISEDAIENGTLVAHDLLSLHVKVKEPGYLYVFLSNENPTLVDVYFDDFTIERYTSIQQLNDYYPFGVRIEPNSFTNAPAGSKEYLYNGGSEWVSELGLDQYTTAYRGYNPYTGRFTATDPKADLYASQTPYNYAFNSPLVFNDPLGDDPYDNFLATRYKLDPNNPNEMWNQDWDGLMGRFDYFDPETGRLKRWVRQTAPLYIYNRWENDGNGGYTDAYEILSYRGEGQNEEFRARAKAAVVQQTPENGPGDGWWDGVKHRFNVMLGNEKPTPEELAEVFNPDGSHRIIVKGTPPSFIGGPVGKGQHAIKLGKYLLNPNAYHAVKATFLARVGLKNFSHIVGTNPDITYKGTKIILTGTGPFKGKNYETAFSILEFINTFF